MMDLTSDERHCLRILIRSSIGSYELDLKLNPSVGEKSYIKKQLALLAPIYEKLITQK